ncbi:MAG: 3-deoxy-manno-octulosonate cytidylyltransferase [Syntrophorhabdaceae bacterium]|nr:3-deoxy-manno-octulosonate cytidylyltransferase [Syntrophorhabdaceae bacterium]
MNIVNVDKESRFKKVIVIPARYASTRLPGKPLIEIKGKSLIQRVFEVAQGSQLKDAVYIATDDEKIKERALSFGAEVIMTGSDCSSGTERVYEALKEKQADLIVNLQGDEPFMRPEMIDMLFADMDRNGHYMATLCSLIKDEREYHEPDTVKVVLDRHGFALYFSRSPIPYLRNRSGLQDPVYKHIGIYGYTKDFLFRYIKMERGVLEEAESLEQLRVLENGYRIKVLVTEYEGFGIDTEADLKRAEEFLNRQAVK